MKKFFKAVGIFIFSLLITLATAGLTFSMVVTPANTKTWLKNSGVYEGLLDSVLAQASKSSNEEQNQSEGENPLAKPEIQEVAKKAITPVFLQSSVENFIDGMNSWLSGASKQPTFNIDISKVKQDFASGLSSYAVTRYNGLPACARGQRPDTTDFLNIQCRVVGYDIKTDADKKAQEIVSEIKLPGGGNNITAETLTEEANKNNQEVFFANNVFPTIYKVNKLVPYIFSGIVVLIGGLIVLLSKPKKKGFKTIGISLIISSILLFLTNFAISTGLKQVSTMASGAEDPMQKFAQKTALSLAESVSKAVQGSYRLFAIVFGITGLMLIVTSIMLGKKSKETSPPPAKTTVTAEPSSPKPPTPQPKSATKTTPKIQG